MRVRVLGPLEVNEGETGLGPRDRVVLEALAARSGTPVPREHLAEALWGERVPASWPKVVQGCVARLRKALGPGSIQTTTQGYLLALHLDELDHRQFERLVSRSRDLLADGEPERAAFLAQRALNLWRGQPLTELDEWPEGHLEAERLVELHLEAQELLVEAELCSGHHDRVLPSARLLVSEQPSRERRWSLLARAEYRAGRQADALATLQRARATLVRDLGLDPGPGLTALEQAILRQESSLTIAAAPTPTADCPYPGLLPYDVDDAEAFFGRERDVEACLERLGTVSLLAVVGPSGCGKSSLVRAGLAAALTREGRDVVVIAPGRHPVSALEQARPPASAVLVVDQCEEAFVRPPDDREREAFFGALLAHAAKAPVLLALRADRVGELAAHPDVARRVEQGLYLLSAMSPDDLRRAIQGPADQAGLRLEPGLVDLLVREVEGEPGALPLLSHALRETWERREGPTLTVAAYQQSGGIRESVARSAEEVVRSLAATEQDALRELMLRLVVLNDDGDAVRTHLPRRSLPPMAQGSDLVERLVAARLVAADDDGLEVAHEALVRAWPRLRSWLDDDVEGLRTMRHLSVAAESWTDLGRPESELYRGGRLERAMEWTRRATPALTVTEREFLEASTVLADREERAVEERLRIERRSNQRLRAGLAGIAALLAVSIVASAMAVMQGRRAEAQAQTADGRRLGAEAMRTDAIDQSLLLAVAGLHLHDAPDSRATVLATLDRAPALIGTARLDTVATSLAVSPTTGEVALTLPEATAGADGGIALIDGTTLEQRRIAPAGKGPAVVALHDGRWVTSALAQETGPGRPALRLLAPDGTPQSPGFGGLPGAAFAQQLIAVSPGGRWLAAALTDPARAGMHPTGVWDVRAPSRPFALLDLGALSAAPAVSDDGRTLYIAVDDTVRAVALPQGRILRSATARDLGLTTIDGGLVLHPDGRTLAVAGGAQTALIDAETLAPRTLLESGLHSGGLSFSRDGARLAVAGDEVTVWEPATDPSTPLLRQPAAGGWPAFSPDGTTLYTVEFSGLLEAWDLQGARRAVSSERIAPSGGSGYLARWSPDRTKIAFTAGHGVGAPPITLIHDVATGRSRELDPGVVEHGSILDLAWSPDSRRVTVTTGDRRVVVVDATGDEPPVEHLLEGTMADGRPDSAAYAWWTPDGATLLVGSSAGRLHVLDARTLEPRRPAIQATGAVGAEPAPALVGFEVSPDGRTVLAAGSLIDVTSGTRTTPKTLAGVHTAKWSPDGTRMFVVDQDGAVGIVDTHTWEWITAPTNAHPFRGWRSTWSADGSKVATTAGGAVGHWDGRTGEFLGSALLDTDGDVAFSADGRTILVAGDDGRLLRWSISVDRWVDAACRLAGRELTREEWRSYLGDRPYESVCAG
jgi:DNA-binding SARP family transcriptional activator/WD40 repeat protein